jgi:hypothetical protein
LVAIGFSLLASGQSYNLAESGVFLLKPPAAKGIFNQCSRSAPLPTSELWEPSTKDIDHLEIALAKYLKARERAGRPIPPKETKYHRQYVGFVRNGERYIYGNFYPGDRAFVTRESRQAVQVCDGGSVFWGIVYRLSTKSFEDPQFNGNA